MSSFQTCSRINNASSIGSRRFIALKYLSAAASRPAEVHLAHPLPLGHTLAQRHPQGLCPQSCVLCRWKEGGSWWAGISGQGHRLPAASEKGWHHRWWATGRTYPSPLFPGHTAFVSGGEEEDKDFKEFENKHICPLLLELALGIVLNVDGHFVFDVFCSLDVLIGIWNRKPIRKQPDAILN